MNTIDIHSADERATYLAESMHKIVELIASPLVTTDSGEAIDTIEAIRLMRREDVDAAFEGREVELPFSAEAAVKALIGRMNDLFLTAESIEMLASDVSARLGGPEFAEED